MTTLKPRLAAADMIRTKLPPKVADPELLTAEHRIWRAAVITAAGGRCQWPEGCEKSAPRHRMFADHIVERKDGGSPVAAKLPINYNDLGRLRAALPFCGTRRLSY